MKKYFIRRKDVWHCLCIAIGFATIGFKVSNDLLTLYVAQESNITSTPTGASKDCLVQNSYAWLSSRRMSNGRQIPYGYGINMTAKFDPFSRISELLPYLGQSLADKRSSFVDTSFPIDLGDVRPLSIHQWAVKLIFIAIQYHQHRPARQEAKVRLQHASSKKCRLQMEHHNVGNFDYECRDSKFIVGGLTANGLGSNVRAAISTLILSGLVTNRTAVLIQNGEEGPKFIKKPWTLSSCIRKDFQCVYYPITACTLTWEMVANGYILDEPYAVYFGDGTVRNIPDSQLENRVWVLQKYGTTEVPPRTAVDLVIGYIRELVEDIPLETGERNFFREVYRYIVDSTYSRPKRNFSSFSYPAAANVVNHAAEVFALRPNFQSRIILDEIMRDVAPPVNESSSLLIGLPIRASDKCRRESECLSFAGHMNAVERIKQSFAVKMKTDEKLTKNTQTQTILFTSESAEMTNAQRTYSMTSSDKFLVNFRDVTPGSGLVGEVLSTGRFTADENMIASLSTLLFQMKAQVSVLNCCSNFHMLLKDFLLAGLGSFSDSNPICLQDFKELEFRLCCAWEMVECKARKVNRR